MSRLPAGGRIDRSREIGFTFDGKPYTGYQGDTLAAALLANGVHRVASSVALGRPRGIVTASSAEPSGLVQLLAPIAEPMLPATTVELSPGLQARGVAGRGELAERPVASGQVRYDRSHLHCDLLVVGAGPAGLAAAHTAAGSGARVVLLDERPEAGGSLLDTPAGLTGWPGRLLADLTAQPELRLLTRTTAFGCYQDNLVLAVQNLPAGAGNPATGARQRVWRIRTRQLLLATGAHERLVAFADNDRPGIMLASAARSYLNCYGVLAGQQVLVFTGNDAAYPAAVELAAAGAQVSVLDVRTEIAPHWQEQCDQHRVAVRLGQLVYGSAGAGPDGRVSAAVIGPVGAGGSESVPCDLLLVSGGWNPAVQLFSQSGGRLRYDRAVGGFVPAGELPAVRVAGAAAGQSDLASCLAAGASAAATALAELGIAATPTVVPDLDPEPTGGPAQPLWAVPSGDRADRCFVDLARDATVADLARATGAGLRSVEHIKRYTTIGTGPEQGSSAGPLASAVIAELLGVDIDALGLTTFRPPYRPIAFATLAGRDRGALFEPIRTSAIHRWHVEQGAVFENVGQWQRPHYYPQLDEAGEPESLATAAARECRVARTGVAMMDVSTLGKISVQGADAGTFLDRMYTNVMSSLRPGSIRYGVLCGLDGMVLDDGTVARISPTEFVLTTTTGNAALVLDWLEEFAQTEWPQLRVHLTSVTEHWSTIALVGPDSRAVLGSLAPDLDVSAEAFRFMTWQPATVAGLPVRVCRISFSGELAYELNVTSWYGLALWQAVHEAGQPYRITPYGTETMHVLRAEKGYPIIGQETDGTVSPADLGLEWLVSKKKSDFIGMRSHRRPDNLRADRQQLVGLLPEDRQQLLTEGAQLIAESAVSTLPVAMLGQVTSSYRSVALDRTFALALLSGGRQRLGDRLFAWQDGQIVPVTVVEPVFYDPEGHRRDG